MYTEIRTDETFMIVASWIELLRVGIYRGYLWQTLVSICDGALRDGFDFFFSGDFY